MKYIILAFLLFSYSDFMCECVNICIHKHAHNTHIYKHKFNSSWKKAYCQSGSGGRRVEKTTHWFQMSLEPVRKGCPLSPFSQTSSVVPWAISSCFTWSNNNTGKKKIHKTEWSLNYLLGLSRSSIAANSFCLAFLLMCVPRQTFTKLVSCLVEYSCPK